MVTRTKKVKIQDVSLPFSDGTLSAQTWKVGKRVVVAVPELGLHLAGKSQEEVVFRLFTSLLKYYRQLSQYPERLSSHGLAHLKLLRVWVASIESRLTARAEIDNVVALSRR